MNLWIYNENKNCVQCINTEHSVFSLYIMDNKENKDCVQCINFKDKTKYFVYSNMNKNY